MPKVPRYSRKYLISRLCLTSFPPSPSPPSVTRTTRSQSPQLSILDSFSSQLFNFQVIDPSRFSPVFSSSIARDLWRIISCLRLKLRRSHRMFTTDQSRSLSPYSFAPYNILYSYFTASRPLDTYREPRRLSGTAAHAAAAVFPLASPRY